jgi:hypothetical protein
VSGAVKVWDVAELRGTAADGEVRRMSSPTRQADVR